MLQVLHSDVSLWRIACQKQLNRQTRHVVFNWTVSTIPMFTLLQIAFAALWGTKVIVSYNRVTRSPIIK